MLSRMTDPVLEWLSRPNGGRLAIQHDHGDGPATVFIHGLMSHMQGEKASALAAHASARGREFLRFDQFGHGQSDGAFEDGTVSGWRDDCLLALDRVRAPQAILVGSSIGGWLALLAALSRPAKVGGLVLIAPAADMTRRISLGLTEEARAALRDRGVWHRPSRYGAPIPITQRMLEDGDRSCLLRGPIEVDCPVRILHGQQDPDVPWRESLLLADRLRSSDIRTILLKDGDHRLSRPDQLALINATVDSLWAGAAQAVSASRIAASPSR